MFIRVQKLFLFIIICNVLFYYYYLCTMELGSHHNGHDISYTNKKGEKLFHEIFFTYPL